jgi:NAD-dependent dihydropyrimidine dehydrogenase PreA subunit
MIRPWLDSRRCVRYRWRASTCRACEEVCPQAAIRPLSARGIDPDTCSGCMLCASVCPAEAPRTHGEPVEKVLERLSSFDRPVLGCLTGGAPGHDRVVCLGALSEEHLLALTCLVMAPVTLNATRCGRCANTAVLGTLRERVKRVQSLDLLSDHDGVTLIEDPESVRAENFPSDRRYVFRVARALSTRTNGEARSDASPLDRSPLPERQRLVNAVSAHLGGEPATRVIRRYGFRLKFGSGCDQCRRCASLCPTNALRRETTEQGKSLRFQPDRCTGCGLCVEFCPTNVLSMLPPLHRSRCFGSMRGRNDVEAETASLPKIARESPARQRAATAGWP